MSAPKASKNLNLVLWGTFDLGKPRVRILEKGLLENGVKVQRCHAPVWEDIEDKSQIKGLRKRLSILLKWLIAYPMLIWRYLNMPDHDAVMVSYLGHLDVLILWLFAKLRKKPIIWDAFLSLYDTIVLDRELVSKKNPLSWFIWCWEWLACKACDLVISDTQVHSDYFAKSYRLPEHKSRSVFVGAEPEQFPLTPSPPNNKKYTVLFYGQFIPLHGIDTILEAAKLCHNDEIHWILIGSGQETSYINKAYKDDPVLHIKWIEWVEYSQLSQWISQADICLGIFGSSRKAASVIPNKVFQSLMCGKPLITRDSPAIRELSHFIANDYIQLVPANDPVALALAVLKNKESHLPKLPPDRDCIMPKAIGQILANHIHDHLNA